MADTRVRRRVVTGVGAAVIIGLAVGGYAYATAPGGPDLRLADATYADVSQTLTSAGTVVPVDQAAVNFPVAGRVAAVSVSVGQQVTAGQPLAVLDTTGLTAQLSAAQATVAADQAKLTTDEDHQTSAATGSGDGGSGGGSGGSSNASDSTGGSGGGSNARASGGDGGGSNGAGGSGGGGNASASTNAAVTAAQHKLVSDQQKADGTLRAASAALTHANQLCGPTTGSPGTTPTGTASNSTAGDGSAPGTPAATGGATGTSGGGSATGSPSGGTTGSGSAAGSSASGSPAHDSGLTTGSPSGGTTISGSATGGPASGSPAGGGSTASGSGGAGGHSTNGGPAAGAPTPGGQIDPAECRAALDTALAGQNAVGAAQGTVETDINALTTILNSASHASSGATTSRAASNTAGRTTSTEATTVTPEQLVADQSTIDAAQAAVDEAQQDLAQAQLVSPVNGTVGQVSLAAGEQVGTSPTTPEVTVIGTGGDQVTTTIDAAVVGEAKVGDRVQVTPDGGTRAVTGHILTIGLLPATTTSTGYPVTIELDDPGAPLADGAGADVAISVDEVTHVLTVPTSAVTLTRGGAMVHVLRDGARTTARVAVGAVGAERTQITSGLQAGDQVILADLAQPLPTTTANTGRGVRNLI